VIAGGRVVVAPFARSLAPSDTTTRAGAHTSRVVARWMDGAPAAIESALGSGCIRAVGIPLPVAGDLTLRPEFGLFLAELLVPCGGRRLVAPAEESVVMRLAGSGALATARSVRAAETAGSSSRAAAWLLIGALVLAVVDHLLRRRHGAVPDGRARHATGRSSAPIGPAGLDA
jgi:hypothetical protein